MTDREKLINLILQRSDFKFVNGAERKCIIKANLGELIDDLLAGGVTVREKQKPIKRGYLLGNSPCWLEEVYENGLYALEIVEITKGTGPNYYSYSIGSENADLHNGQLYGKTWRCWAEKPTEEERKAAEWDR